MRKFSHSSPRARLLVGLVALLLPLGLACRTTPLKTGAAPIAPAAAASVPQEVRVYVTEWAFTPDKIRLPGGQPVTLILENKGQLEHDITIPQLNVSLTAAAGPQSIRSRSTWGSRALHSRPLPLKAFPGSST